MVTVVTRASERQRLPQADDARAADGDRLIAFRHQSPSATPSRRGSAPPSRPVFGHGDDVEPLTRSARWTLCPTPRARVARLFHSAPARSRTASPVEPKLTSAAACGRVEAPVDQRDERLDVVEDDGRRRRGCRERSGDAPSRRWRRRGSDPKSSAGACRPPRDWRPGCRSRRRGRTRSR